MLVKPIFRLLGCPFNFGSDHHNAKIPIDVAIMGIPRGVYYSPQYVVLKLLYPLGVTGTTPQLYSINSVWFHDIVVYQHFVLYC
jgi:hypothetical protein